MLYRTSGFGRSHAALTIHVVPLFLQFGLAMWTPFFGYVADVRL